jgi:apolipoprotein D and lipocalin family protein
MKERKFPRPGGREGRIPKVKLGPAAAILLSCLTAGCGAPHRVPSSSLETVDKVEPRRYMGTWYDIGHYPFKYQRGCEGTTATYRLREDGKIEVVNECRKGGAGGKTAKARGVAWAVDSTYAKLKVRFFWPFTGDYWIIGLGENYEYAVVGHPKRKYLWILSRTPSIDEAVYGRILEEIREKGYDPSRIVKTPHP